MGQVGFFHLIKNYAETTLWIDKKFISQEASYAAQQGLTRIKSPKICANCLKFIFKQRFWVLYIKNLIMTIKWKFFLLYSFLDI